MYISIPVLLIIAFVIFNKNQKSLGEDLVDTIYGLLGIGAILLVLALIFGFFVFSAFFVASYKEEIFIVLQGAGLIILGFILLKVVIAEPILVAKIVGSVLGFAFVFNLVVYSFQEHFSMVSYIIATTLIIGVVCAWVPFIKNLRK